MSSLQLIFNGEVIGCINLASHTHQIIPEEDALSLETIGKQIARVIFNIELQKKLQIN